jgi:KDO2-lipid IV(A) lauroyltransferase
MIGYYFFLVIERILMLLPGVVRRSLFAALAWVAYHVDRKHRRVIGQNLDFALPGLDASQKDQISRYCYKNLLRALLQVMENQYNRREELEKIVRFEGLDIVEQAKKSGRPIIFVTAHYGNWELGGAALGSLIMPVTVVHKALNNAYFDDYLHRARSRFDLSMVEKRGAVKQLAKVLKAKGSISLLTDQNTNEKDGIVVNFFGRDARQTAAPAFLARKYDALIIPLYIETDDDVTHKVTFYDAIEVSKTEHAEADILEATQKQADLLEKIIRKKPKFWFWCHRRWKTEHPEIYRT